jgi:hypothetical protein
MEDMQSTFRYAVKTKSLPATANVGCTFGIFSIIKELLVSLLSMPSINLD